MSEEKPRLARLTAVLTQLQSKRLVTAAELAAKHGVSIRTIYRDIRTLEKSGVPIVTEEGRGYTIMEGYRLPPIMFTESEANALITAQHIINRNKDQSIIEAYNKAIIKIQSVMKGAAKEKTSMLSDRIQVRDNKFSIQSSNYLLFIQRAITNYQVLHLEYVTAEGHESKRKVEPFAIFSTNSNWIMVAFCLKVKEFRAFRLDRIQSLKEMGGTFIPHQKTLQQYFEDCQKNWQKTPDIPLTPARSNFVLNQNFSTMKKVTIEPFKMIGIAVRTSNEGNQAMVDIPNQWKKFQMEQVHSKIPNKLQEEVIGAYTNYEGDHNKPYDFIIGCKVSDFSKVPEGMSTYEFDGGAYNAFVSKGNLLEGAITKTWYEIWQMGLNRSYQADFEVYGEKAQDFTNAEVDMYIGVNN